MATFSAQIQDLVGTFSDETAMDQWLEDGVRELVSVFPPNLKEMCYAKNTFTSAAAGSEAETIATRHLGSVFAGSVDCRPISGSFKYRASDSGSIEYATSSDPVYYIEGGKLNILPASLSGVYYLIADPSIDASADSAISSFPNEAEYLVVLYASIKALQQQMNTKQDDLPSDVEVPVMGILTSSLPTWTAPSDFVVTVPPDTPSLTAVTFTSIDSDIDASLPTYTTATINSSSTYTGSAPTYTKPPITARVAFSSYTSGLSETDPGIFNLAAVVPQSPTITAASVSITGTAPAYTKPAFSVPTLGSVGDLSMPTVPTVPAITPQSIADFSSAAPAYSKPGHPSQVAFSSYTSGLSEVDPGVLSVTAVAPAPPSAPSFSTPVIGDITVASTTLTNLGVAPTYSKSSITTRSSFNDFFESGSLNPFDDSDPGVFSLSAVVPASITISSQSISDPSSYAPAYTKPTLALSVTPTISDLSITAVPPDVPSLTSVTFTSIDSDIDASLPTYTTATVSAGGVYGASTAPTYTKPTITSRVSFDTFFEDTSNANPFGDSDPGAFVVTAVAPAAPLVSTTSVSFSQTAPTFTKPVVAPDFAQVNTYIDTDEDVELATSKLQEISAQLQEYSANIQNEQVEFNKENSEYQAQLQISIQNAQFDNQEDARILQKYQSEVQTYQANVNKEVQAYGQKLSRYTTELNTVQQAWSKTESDSLQQYSTDIQNELNEYNKKNTSFQANIQEAMQEIQVANQVNIASAQGELQLNLDNENRSQQRQFQNTINDMKAIYDNNSQLIQKYQAEVAEYQAEVNTEVQEYQQNLAGDIQVWQAERQTDLQKYNSDIQNELNEFNKENAKYQAILQEYIQEAQLLDAHEARKIQKYQAEVSTYQAKVNEDVQAYGQKFSRYTTEMNTVYQSWAKTESDSLQQYSADIQNELNEFNKENAAYQVKLQEATQQAQLDAQKAQQQAQVDSTDAQQTASLLLQQENQEYASQLQKYQAEVSKYQADVSTQVQEYTQKVSQYQLELNTSYQAWAKTESDNLQVFQSDIQNELNEFNKENAIYQATIQEKIQEAQLLDAHEARKLQVYQAEVQSYQADVNATIQEWVNEEWNQNFQKYQTDYSSKLQEYSTNLQNELNEFNKENVEYQAKLQKDIQDAQLEDAEESKKLQKYQSEVSSYQAQVSSQVQEYTQKVSQYQIELNTAYQAWSKTESDSLSQYSADMQNELNEYNKENVAYQSAIQESMQEIQVANQVNIAKAQGELQLNLDNENRSQQRQFQNVMNDMKAIFDNNSQLITKYQAEIAGLGAELNANVQEFTQELTKNRAAFDTSLQNYQAELQKVTADNQSKIQLFTGEVSNFTQIIQKSGIDYQWLQSQYTQLKADYQQGLQLLITGGVAPQPQQQQQRR